MITIIDPGVKYDPGYEVFDSGLERDVFCRTEEATSISARYGQATPPSPISPLRRRVTGGVISTPPTSRPGWRAFGMT